MSKTMDTSQWIQFFRKAGLPSNVAANYAIIFFDNRIQVDMLLDLSKEYLYDMGIKVMGDVIAILKYAKEFHNQLAKERMIGHTATVSKNTVAERMVGRYTRPVVPSPVRSPVGQSERVVQNRSTIISLKRKPAEESPVKKVRRVPPEEEGAYKIKMPLGITEKTRKILQQQQGSKRSVFARLGDSAVSSSTDSKNMQDIINHERSPRCSGHTVQKLNVKSRLGGKVGARNITRTKIMLSKHKVPLNGQSNVFERLG
ncbi:hypothetical protein HNY73_014649 [Argiope bruennichi]|uniref:DUF5577 domain-containing protein n=1 Tax=Argiope bruennichi TaxID=94029 RepID=A0A8T0ERG4_ARGBR|nr:hypothetical protein HNY73_014649 [Argiope bruennichi]